MPEAAWHNYYALTFGLYNALAECEYLKGQSEKSEELYEILLANTKGGLDKAKLCAIRLVQTIGIGLWHQSIEFGILGLEYLDIKVTSEPDKVKDLLQSQSNLFEKALIKTPLHQVIDLPEMTDAKLLVASNIMPNLSTCGQILGAHDFQQYCTLLGLNMTLSSGKSDLTPILFACHANFLSKEGRLSEAYGIAQQAIKISDLYPDCRELSNTYNMLAGLVIYLKSSYPDAIKLHQ